MSLPIAQHRVLAYLADCSPSGAGAIASALRMNRDKVRGALNLLIGKGLASADPAMYPLSFAITEQGRKELAEAS
jgi:DNA-binding IclR family transcriptional regulator